MSDQQIDALFDALRSLRDRNLVLLMLNAGLRPGETLGLHLGDIGYGRRRVFVRCRDDHPKGAARSRDFVSIVSTNIPTVRLACAFLPEKPCANASSQCTRKPRCRFGP